MSELLAVAAAGQADVVRTWFAAVGRDRAESDLVELYNSLAERRVRDPAGCQTVLDAVMPLVADPALGLQLHFALFLTIAAWVSPDGYELFPLALECAESERAAVGRARILEDWGHWHLRAGDTASAGRRFAQAQHEYDAAGETARGEAVWVARAQALAHGADGKKVVRRLRTWIASCASTGVRCRLLIELALCELRRDRPRAANRSLIAARRASRAGELQPRLWTARAQWYWRLGEVARARHLLRRAARWYRRARMDREWCVVHANLAAVQVSNDRHLEPTVRKMLRLRDAIGRTEPLIDWQLALNLATALQRLGREVDAARVYRDMLSIPAVRVWDRRLAQLNALHLEADGGASPDAQTEALIADPTVRADRYLAFLAHEVRGTWLAREGRTDEAVASLRAALAAVEQSRVALPWEFLRRRLQRSRARIYDRLQDLLIAGRRDDEAWRIADQFRAQSAADFLGGYPHLGKRSRRAFARIRMRLDDAYRGGGDRADALERQLDRLFTLSSREYGNRDTAVAAESWLATRDESAAFIQFEDGRFGFGAYVLRGGRCRFHRLPAPAAALLPRVAVWWARQDGGETSKGDEQWRRETGEWYRTLIAPFADELEGVSRVVIAPLGALALVPWAGLWDESARGYWLDRLPGGVSVVPGARVASAPIGGGERGMVLVAPPSNLLLAPAEAELLKEQFAPCVLDRPTADDIRRALDGADWLHATCHGTFDPARPLASYLDLGERRRWTGWDLLAVPVTGKTLILASCCVGTSRVEAGGEWFGLLRGFLMGGAATVVAATWRLHDLPALVQMRAFYCVNDLNPWTIPASLAAAQRATRRAGRWAEEVRQLREEIENRLQWEQSLAVDDTIPGAAEDPAAARDARQALGDAMRCWVNSPAGCNANSRQQSRQLGIFLTRLAAAGHPRHWAALQAYGAPPPRSALIGSPPHA